MTYISILGEAGRGKLRSNRIIQTYFSDLYCVSFASNSDKVDPLKHFIVFSALSTILLLHKLPILPS
jgi:hypothetical protein